MKRRLITALLIAVCSCLGNTSKADIITLYPTNDAYIVSTEPGMVHNNDSFSVGYNNNGDITRSYLMFDLSAIPVSQSITAAALRLETFSYTLLSPPTIDAYYLEDDNWSESTLTWNNAPTNFSSTAADTQLVDTDEVFWTVTSDVSNAYGDNNIYSVVLKLPSETPGTEAIFYSKDLGFIDWSPYLMIQYQPIPEPATLILLGLGGSILRKRRA